MFKPIKTTALLIAFFIFSFSILAQDISLQIDTYADGPDRVYDDFFDYQVDVFGIMIYASDDFNDEQILHVASIMAEYLDNDEDGEPDNPDVVQAMIKNGANIVMLWDEDELDDFADELFEDEPDFMLQPVLSYDIVIGGSRRDSFDATIEEVWHLISFSGYAFAYPDVFGEEDGTEIADLMDNARGGQFFNVPRRYPEDAWFTYDDETCEYDCMISEYFYWALTSLLGGQDFPGRADEIEHEWRYYNENLIRSGDPDIVALLENPDYVLPTRLPDGEYKG